MKLLTIAGWASCVLAAGLAAGTVTEAAKHYGHFKPYRSPTYAAAERSPCVTVTRDYQSPALEFRGEQFIANQTAADVAGCGAPFYGAVAWVPTAVDMFLTHPQARTVQLRQPVVIHRTIRVQ